MLDDFKIKYGESSSNNNKEVTGDENINFIQKNDDKVSDSIKQIADNLDEISGKVANNDHELNTDSSISFVEKKDKIKKTKTKAKAKKKKPSEKSIPRPKDIAYKIVKEKNPLLSDKKKLKFSYKKCSIKTGKINFLIKRPVAPTNTITIMPVFIMITTDKLILKKGEKKTNYIRSIPLVELQRIDQHYVNTFCFDIIIDEIVGKKLKAGQLTLCANNLAEMNMWVTTILDFKRCSIGVNSVDHNGKLVLDMNELNKFTRSGKSSLSNLFYSGKNKRRAKSRKEMKLSKTLSSMITSAQKGEIASHQLRRQFSGRLMKARSFEHEIEGKSYNLKRILANRVFREKEQEASAYAQRTARKEMRILRNVQQQMSSMSRSELSSYTTIYQNQINMQKELAKKKAMALMHIINEQDQLTDYRICFSPTFKNFKNKPKITAVCKQYYGKYVKLFLFRVKMYAKREEAFAQCVVIFISVLNSQIRDSHVEGNVKRS